MPFESIKRMMQTRMTELSSILRQEKALLDNYLQLLADEQRSICERDWHGAERVLEAGNSLARRASNLENRRHACLAGIAELETAKASSGPLATERLDGWSLEERGEPWPTFDEVEKEVILLRHRINMMIDDSLKLIASTVGQEMAISESIRNIENSLGGICVGDYSENR